MAWSFAARRRGEGQNDCKEAQGFVKQINNQIQV
jgi:hypothetical protein